MPLFGKSSKAEVSEQTEAPRLEPAHRTPANDGPFNWPHALERPALSDLPFLFKALENRVQKVEARVGLSIADATVAREAAKAGAELDVKATFTPGPDSTMAKLLHAEKEMVRIQAQKSIAAHEMQEARRKKTGQAHLLHMEKMHHAQEILYDERLAALKQVSQVETERAQISAEKEDIEQRLALHREYLQNAKPGKQRVDLQAKLRKLEADLGAKVSLTRDLDAALAKVSEAEQERAHILAKNQQSYVDMELGTNDDAPPAIEDTADYPSASDGSIDKLAAEFHRERDYTRGVTTRLQVKLAEMMEMMASMLEGDRGHGHHNAKSSHDAGKYPHKAADEVKNMSDTELLVRVRESLGELSMQLNPSSDESAV